MKIAKTATVVLASEDGDARFVFRLPGLNELQREAQELGKIEDKMERMTKELALSFARLESVEGLEDERGALSVEDVRALTLPINILTAIHAGYVNAYLSLLKRKEPPQEKKEGLSA